MKGRRNGIRVESKKDEDEEGKKASRGVGE